MYRNLLNLAVFSVGLAAVCWIGAGYVGSNPLGLAVAMVISACYVAGGLELHRYRQATTTLTHAVTDLSATPTSLSSWLERLHPSLRNATRLRVEGERVALPVPALTPYLVGLLVLLGMLGTLLGMMATLRGTGLALESATDLQAMRGSLAAPVKGLGFAFGTSIAGVASSAMLGLLSALCRRERLQAVQLLDAKIATTLRIYSQSHQREETFKLLQQQTALMPTLVDRLQTMMATIEQQSVAANERQIASQEAFHGKTEAAYTRLASSMEQSLKESVAESARAAGAALQPVMEATMAGLARETASLHGTVTQAVQRQLDGLSSGFETTTTTVADIWNQALAAHRQSNETLVHDLRSALDQFTATFEQRSTGLLEGVFTRLDTTAGSVADAWNHALSQQDGVNEKLAAHHQQALTTAAASFEQHSASLIRTVDQSHADLQTALAAQDQQRLAAWTETLDSMTAALNTHWEQAGVHAASRQQEICDTLARTASDISAQTQAHASNTIAEISRLVQAASEAPKAAAEVAAELRQKLSDSMVRDTAMLEERSRLLATVETLLDAVNHASTEQRVAVDALVTTSADLLDRVSTRFTDHIEAETGKLGAVAAQVTSGAVEVASLSEAFGAAVQMYGNSNEALMDRLQHIATALDKSLARSDEQLAYYVAQAREVIDLSMLSQKQIVEDLQQLSHQRASAGAEVA
ncbi:DUF802 domain-containing protein [Dyella koreensis]|uniref:DUF802 domain-containing protein n=1 Tax=Dyella koreensis TaxID=311235 RepID=A0ABW8K750_9GAMM